MSPSEYYNHEPLIRAIEQRIETLKHEREAETINKSRPYVLAAISKEKYDLLDVLNRIKPGPALREPMPAIPDMGDPWAPDVAISKRESHND